MRFRVLVSSEKYLSSAGSRIRYDRIASYMRSGGVSVSVETIDKFDFCSIKTGDTFLFSKIQDSRSVGLSLFLLQKGYLSGVDLFDDYFSQSDDPRFSNQRNWLSQIAKSSSFFLCSTDRMLSVANKYFGEVPGHVLHDPFDVFNSGALLVSLNEKLRKVRDSRVIKAIWFGMGDNPNFSVGIDDLVHYADALGEFEKYGFEVDLQVLTNLRALNALGLSKLRSLPIKHEIHEWTRELEQQLLEESFLAFLPVNGQNFSRAKSLNRAVTALTSGNQILSVGYPLYAPLNDFVYRHVHELARDLVDGDTLVSSSTLKALEARLDDISNPAREAGALIDFLTSLSPQPHSLTTRIAILHGLKSSGAIHKFARKAQWLSLGSPYTPIGLSYDAHIAIFKSQLTPSLRFSSRVVSNIPDHLKSHMLKLDDGHGFEWELDLRHFRYDVRNLSCSAEEGQHSLSKESPAYLNNIEIIENLYKEIFGEMVIVHSDNEKMFNIVKEIC